jgi:thiamine-phosphate pyrophosphorylase
MSEPLDTLYPCRLYLISPPQIVLPAFADSLEQAFSGGDVGAFQLRLKDVSDDEILRAAEALLPVCRKYEVAFILNDRPDLARKAGADGVHIGQEDASLADARALLGEDAVIGVTCHASAHMAMEAGDGGADYVAFGAFFPTTSKSIEKQEQYGRPEPQLLEWWSTYTVVPSVAIGGITPENCAPLVAAGADFVAAITAVWNHPAGPGAAVLAFNEAISAGLKQRANA